MTSRAVFLRYAGLAFVTAVIFYFTAFFWIEGRRHAKGPWEVVFLTDYSGNPSVLITQPKLKISNQTLTFPGQKFPRKNLVKALYFDSPTVTNLPFGKVIFHDLTFLPGTLTFDFFGHEVELLPRTLVIDRKEHSWKSKGPIAIRGKKAVPAAPKAPDKKVQLRLIDKLKRAAVSS